MGTGAWSLWSETAQSESRWDFSGGALSTGQTFSIDWKNNSISTGNAVQFALLRSDGTEAFGFRFLGGASNYSIKGDGTWFEEDSMGYENTALTLSFELLSADTYQFTATRQSDNTIVMQTGIYGLGGTTGLGLTYTAFFNNAKSFGTGDLNLNSLTVVPEPSTYALFAGLLGLTCVAMRRRK